MLNNIVEVERENAHLRKCLDDQIVAERQLRIEVENLTNQVAHHKRIRKAITRQIKDVEKARKYEFDLYLDRFSRAQDIIKSLKDEIKQLKDSNTSWLKMFKI